MDLKEKIEQGHILARIIIEIMGSPKEYVEKTLKIVTDKLKEEKDLDVIKIETFDAEEKDKLFSGFTEVEILFKDTTTLLGFSFDYMPSSIEILEPLRFNHKSSEFSSLLNDLLARMHQSDMVLKNLNAESKLMRENFSKLLQNTISVLLATRKEMEIDSIANLVGISKEKLEPFIKKLVEKGLLTTNENRYSLSKK